MLDIKEKQFFELLKFRFKYNNFIDVGSCKGEWCDYVLNWFSDAKINLFEPLMDNYIFLSNKYISNSNIKIYNIGLSDKHDNLDFFYIKENNINLQGLSSFVYREIFKKYNTIKYNFNVNSLDNINLPFETIDYMKIDTEGFEFNIIKGCENYLLNKKINFIQFEYGGTYKDAKIKLNDIIFFLNKFNYNVYDYINKKFIKITDYIDDYKYNNLIATWENLDVI